MKRCPACLRDLALEQFSKDRSRPDGVSHLCRRCIATKRRVDQTAKKERDAFLTAHYSRRGPAWCARELGVAYGTIAWRAKKLGLKCEGPIERPSRQKSQSRTVSPR